MCSKLITILLSPASERSRSIWLVIIREITNTFSLKTHSLSLVWLKTKGTHIVVSLVHQKLSLSNLSLDNLKTCLYSFEDEAVATANLRSWQNHFRACWRMAFMFAARKFQRYLKACPPNSPHGFAVPLPKLYRR